jgi:tRNA modification GTPase
MLVDLAGLGEPAAGVDRAAQGAARREVAQADVVVVWNGEGRGGLPTPEGVGFGAEVVWVRGKADLEVGSVDACPRRGVIAVSGTTGRGLDALRAAIAEAVRRRGATTAGTSLLLLPRHLEALDRADAALQTAATLIGGDDELIAAALREALDALRDLGGDVTRDDLLGRVFSSFCVGK